MTPPKPVLEQHSCSRCRWMGFFPQPYGSIEYFCSRRQETVPSATLAKRRCADFEP